MTVWLKAHTKIIDRMAEGAYPNYPITGELETSSGSETDTIPDDVLDAVAFASEPLVGDVDVSDGLGTLGASCELDGDDACMESVAWSDDDVRAFRANAHNARLCLAHANGLSKDNRRKFFSNLLMVNTDLHNAVSRVCALFATGWVWTDKWGGCFAQRDEVESRRRVCFESRGQILQRRAVESHHSSLQVHGQRAPRLVDH